MYLRRVSTYLLPSKFLPRRHSSTKTGLPWRFQRSRSFGRIVGVEELVPIGTSRGGMRIYRKFSMVRQ
jgi:hypothetical protein